MEHLYLLHEIEEKQNYIRHSLRVWLNLSKKNGYSMKK